MNMSTCLADSLQLDKICRACLIEKSNMKPLYGACLDEMLNSFVLIQAQHNDGLPSLMCEQCVLQCRAAYTFKQLCKKSDNILHAFIKPELQAQLQNSVTLFHTKIEVDKSCEVDQYVDIANVYIKDEIEPEFVSCADSDLKLDQSTLEQADDDSEDSTPAPKEVELNAHLIDNAHVCTICSKSFAKASKLKRHLNVHLDEKPYQCDQCDKSYTDSTNLKRHKKNHTGELRKVIKPQKCSLCNKAFRWPSSLIEHMIKYHTDHKLFSCSYCNKKFVEARKLEIHVKSHMGKQPYICKTCGKAYTASYTLMVHQRVHTGEKPYKCKTCGKCFSVHHSLTIHTRTHTGLKSHFCDVCGKGFNSSGNLLLHIMKHTGEKPHVCNECDKKFASANSLKLHIKSHLKQKEKQKRQTKISNKNIVPNDAIDEVEIFENS